ncbi:MAG: hypothetical protein CML33_01340 [Rhodobacteraceae bacterium]|nr:hypothetical protein [Paracoccaceae bacterium]
MSNQEQDQEVKLKALQGLLIDEFINRISSGEAAPSDLNAARQLLKDNGIHAGLSKGKPLEQLAEILPFDEAANG